MGGPWCVTPLMRRRAALAASGTVMTRRVPAPGAEWIWIVPSSASIRSLMLTSPRPLPQAALDIEPDAVVGDGDGQAVRRAVEPRATPRAPRCTSSAFCSASWTTRNTHSVTSGGSVSRNVLVDEIHDDDRTVPSRAGVPAARAPARSAGAWPDTAGTPDRERFGRSVCVRSQAWAARPACPRPRVRRSSSRSIASSASCWLTSSCSSRAMRARSVSCAFSRREPSVRIRS